MFGYWQCSTGTTTAAAATTAPHFAPCAYVAACLGATNPRLPSNKYMTLDNVDLARLGNVHSPALVNGSTCALVSRRPQTPTDANPNTSGSFPPFKRLTSLDSRLI